MSVCTAPNFKHHVRITIKDVEELFNASFEPPRGQGHAGILFAIDWLDLTTGSKLA